MQEVRQQYPDFLRAIRQDYEVPDQPGVTPAQLCQRLEDHSVRSGNANWTWTEGGQLPLVAGTVHCVRLTDTQARLSAFGRSFTLDSAYRRSYIRAILSVEEQRLRFFFQESAETEPLQIDDQPFQLPDAVRAYDAELADELLL